MKKIYKDLGDRYFSTSVKKYLPDMASSFFGGMIAFFILFVVNILAARWLGPDEYGRYSLIFSVANILAVLFILDLDVSIAYFISKTKQVSRKSVYAVSAILSFMLIFGIFFFAIVMFQEQLRELFHLNSVMFLWALLLGVAIAWKRFFEGVMRGLMLFKKQAVIRIGETVIVLGVFLIMYVVFERTTYDIYIASVILGALFAIALYLMRARKLFGIKDIRKKDMVSLWKYGRFGMLNSFSTLLVKHADKVFLVGIIGFAELGVYTAYYTISILLAGRVVQLIMNVYFPILASKKNKQGLVKKLDTACIQGFVIVFLGALVSMRFLLFFFGSEYSVHWDWLFLLALYVSVHFFASLYGWALASVSEKGYKDQNVGIVAGAIVFVYILFLGNSIYGITIPLVFVAFIFHRLVPGILFFYMARKLK